jgi:sugar phosphate isomerase/epimerase
MPNPVIGLSMLHSLGKSFRKMSHLLAEAPTAYIEIVDDGWHSLNKKRVFALNQIAKSYVLKYTLHSPFADINIASPSKSMLKSSIKRLKQSIAYANGLDAELWVVHPGMKTGISMFYPEAEWNQSVSSIVELAETAEEYGVKVAVENLPAKYGFVMKSPEDFERFHTQTGLDLGIVLDIGHANLETQTEAFFQKVPNKITHVHVSDNLGQDDNHLGIGYGQIDYANVAQRLKQIGYSKTIIVESYDHVEESIKKLKALFA